MRTPITRSTTHGTRKGTAPPLTGTTMSLSQPMTGVMMQHHATTSINNYQQHPNLALPPNYKGKYMRGRSRGSVAVPNNPQKNFSFEKLVKLNNQQHAFQSPSSYVDNFHQTSSSSKPHLIRVKRILASTISNQPPNTAGHSRKSTIGGGLWKFDSRKNGSRLTN